MVGKLYHLQQVVLPAIKNNFDNQVVNGTYDCDKLDDPVHVKMCHIDVRLLEAIELHSNGLNQRANDKIISAIGYLVMLHQSISAEQKNQNCQI